jgi:molybdopterin-containing oxidoreductase family membrane subunit
MQQRVQKTEREINRDLLRPNLTLQLRFFVVVGVCATIVAMAGGALAYAIIKGVGVYGVNRPVMWGFIIVNFVFWVGISHAGVMLSAILRLAQAEWRRPATRAAEVLTMFALGTAALHPVLHTGRQWRTLYWVFPYDFGRGIWPDIRSPFVWDPSAIFTYLSGTIMFVFILLVPDIAVLRDRTTGIMHKVYTVAALGWRGNSKQWQLQLLAGILLSALILPVFVSVHSIVSWDFAVAIAVEGWHATIFAPYFVIGAVHSGVASVITFLAILRWVFRWEDYIRPTHFDALARLMVIVATGWFYFLVIDFGMGFYTGEPGEIAVRYAQMGEWPGNMLFIIFITTGYFLPIPLWLLKNVRQSPMLMFWSSLFVNIGMWLERYILIIPSLERKQSLTFTWGHYAPSPIEVMLVIGSFALVTLGLVTFCKFFPIIPMYDVKEGKVLEQVIRIGKINVPAVFREE